MFSLSTGFEYFSRVLKTADVIVLLAVHFIHCHPRFDWDDFCLSPGPPMPCISPAIGYIFAPNILANIFRVGDCLVIVYGVAWLTPSGYPGSCPREPQDSVQMCGDSDTGGGSGHWRLWDTRPGHPLPSPIMGQCGNIQNSFHPHLNSNLSQLRAVNKHHLNWIRVRHKDLL